MNMKARKRILCACDEDGFEKYNINVYVPEGHPFGVKGLRDLGDFEINCAIIFNGWDISFSRSTLISAIDDSNRLLKYLDDMLERSKIVDTRDLLGAIVIKVDMIGDDAWKITFRLIGGNVAEMFGNDEDNFIIYEVQ